MHADIDKSAKVSDVGDGAFQHHARQQVVHGLDAVGKGRGFELRTRIAALVFPAL